jgi:hypothetical protein
MSTGQANAPNVNAVKALVMAAVGVVLGAFAFKLQLRVLTTAAIGTVVGICVFPLCSVVAVHLSEFEDLSGFETLVGLVLSVTAFAGPLVLGGVYFFLLQQSLCEAGLNVAAASCCSEHDQPWMIRASSARTVGLSAGASVTTPATSDSGSTENRDAAPIFSELAST